MDEVRRWSVLFLVSSVTWLL